MAKAGIALALGLLAAVLAGCSSRPPAKVSGPAASAPAQHAVFKIGSPYQINGTWYYPAEDWSYDESGIASWYGEDFHGKYTANGEVFDLNGLTAAHHTLPMPSIVEVTNFENGRTLRLRVNDRGPFARGRIIDVSRRAAQLLGFERNGTAKVRVRVMVPETIQARSLIQNQNTQIASDVTPAPVARVTAQPLAAPPGVRVAVAPTPLPPPAPPPLPTPVAAAPLPEQVTTAHVRPTNIYIQAGAFSRADNATRLKTKLAGFGPVRVTDATVNGTALYRVRIGPVGSVDEADQLLGRVVDSGVAEARIVVD